MLIIILLILSMLSLIAVRFIPREGKFRNFWLVCCTINIIIVGFFAFRTYQGTLKLEKLEYSTKRLKAGVSTTYEFNGARRETTKPGNISLHLGPEVEVFRKMKEFESQGRYTELIALCKEQIEKTPEWLTPYFYLGLAFANLGNKESAIEMFEYVKENAFGDTAYSEVNYFLERLRKE